MLPPVQTITPAPRSNHKQPRAALPHFAAPTPTRGAYDAQIFTNDREKLGAALEHDVSHSSAHAPEMKQEQAATPQREIAPQQEQSFDIGLGL